MKKKTTGGLRKYIKRGASFYDERANITITNDGDTAITITIKLGSNVMAQAIPAKEVKDETTKN